MKYRDCMIAWTPVGSDFKTGTAGKIEVGYHPDEHGWSGSYQRTTGSCLLARKTMPYWKQVALMFTDFHLIIVRDGIDMKSTHEAFLAIDEYRHTISPDIEGASYAEDECGE